MQVAVEGVEQLETYFGAYLPQLFYAMLAPLTLFGVLSFINLPSAVLLLICVPLIPVTIILVQRWAKKLLARYWNQYTALGDTFLENLQGLTTAKIYQADDFKHKEMNEQSEHFRKITMKVLTMQLNSITLMENLQGLTTAKIYQADDFKHKEMNEQSEHFRKITMKVLTMQLNSITLMDLIAYGGAAKIYQADDFKHKEMNEQSEHFRKITMKVLTMQLNSITLMDLIAYGGAALGVILAVLQFRSGKTDLFGCLMLILLAADFFLPMRLLGSFFHIAMNGMAASEGSFFHIAMNGMAASEKIFHLLDLPEAKQKTASVPDDCSIECRNLRFSYDTGQEILHGIDMTVFSISP